MKKRMIAVIGNGFSEEGTIEYQTSFGLGKSLIENGYRLVTGGLGGVMEASSKGARSSLLHKDGDIIAIIPGLNPITANEYTDIVIGTGMGISRNILVANSDAVIAVGGGSGTLSEIAFAWQLGRLVLCFRGSEEGWSSRLADEYPDERRKGLDIDHPIYGFNTPSDAISIINEVLPIYIRSRLRLR